MRRGLAKIDEAAGLTWLQTHLDYCVRSLLSEPWVLDIDSTIKPLYGRQEGAVVGYDPHKPGRPSHCYFTPGLMAATFVWCWGSMCSRAMNTRQSMARPGCGHCCIGCGPQPVAGFLLRREMWQWGVEPVMARAEQDGLAYLVSPADDGKRQTGADQDDGRNTTGRRRGMAGRARRPRCGWWAGAGSAASVLLRRKLDRPLVILDTPSRSSRGSALCRGRVWIARCGNTPRWSHRWTARSSRWVSLATARPGRLRECF